MGRPLPLQRAAEKVHPGRHPRVDLAAARERARGILENVAAGKDPAADRQATRAEREAQVERAATVGTREMREPERALVREVAARWKGRPLLQVTRVEVHELLDKILDHGAPMRANRLFAELVSSWAAAHGGADDGATAPSPRSRRDRVLSDEEIRLVWSAFDSIGWPFGPIGKLLLLTGARRDEIGSARWSEVDFVSKKWTVAKDGVTRDIPLSESAMRILEGLPRGEGEDGYIFSAAGRIGVPELSRAKAAVDTKMLEIMREQARERGEEPALVNPPARWTLNDLRLTVAAYLQRLNVKLEVAEAVLNRESKQSDGDRGSVLQTGIREREADRACRLGKSSGCARGRLGRARTPRRRALPRRRRRRESAKVGQLTPMDLSLMSNRHLPVHSRE